MKFYIAGNLRDRQEVRAVMDTVREAGYEVIVDWTKDRDLENNYLKNIAEVTERVQRDTQGILNCDVFVLVTTEPSVNKGMYVELGIAIAGWQKSRIPKVYIIGDFCNNGSFYFVRGIRRVQSIDEVMEELK
jgi:hypothetical protein